MVIEEDSKISLLLEDLSSLEEYIGSLFNFFPLPICFVSPLGIILENNSIFEKMANFSPGEAIGEQAEKFFREEEIKKIIEETLEKGFVEEQELGFCPKEKEPIVVQIFTKARKDKEGKIIGFFLTFFDLTKVRKAEEEIRKSQTALLNILEDTEEARKNAEIEKDKTLAVITNFSDGLLVFDNKNQLLLVNPRAEKFLKIDKKEIEGKSASELAEYPQVKPLINILGKEIKVVFRKELSPKKDLVLEVSTVPMKGKEEELGSLVILRDITREKMVERMKTEFVSLAAHQLRTPLSAIKWTLRMLLDNDLGEITKEQKEFIEKTYESNERMIGLINDLLDITRIEEGRYLYKSDLVDFQEIVDSVLDSCQEEISRKEIILNFKKPESKLPKASVDIEKIGLALQNLFDNAVKYTPSRGKIAVSLSYDKNKKEIFFSVRDTGVGIPQDQQARVFTKFFRGVNVVRMETEGSGLGLFISKNIVEAHGGRIWFESKEGEGATFHISLPIQGKPEGLGKDL